MNAAINAVPVLITLAFSSAVTVLLLRQIWRNKHSNPFANPNRKDRMATH